MKIGIDLDGCLAEFVDPFLNYHNRIHGTNFRRREVKSFDFWRLIGGTSKDSQEEIFNFYRSEQFRELPVVPGSVEVIEGLSEEHELYVITARPDWVSRETEQWLGNYFSDRFLEVIHTGEYDSTNESPKSKSDVCKHLGVEVIVEDSYENAIDCTSKGIASVLLDYPWNRNNGNGELPSGVTRVYNWNQIFEEIGEMQNGKY